MSEEEYTFTDEIGPGEDAPKEDLDGSF